MTELSKKLAQAPEDLKKRLQVALKAARLGKEVLLQYLGRLKNVEEKHQAGLVSEADKESEKVIFEYIGKNFPGDELLGEESTLLKNLEKMQPADEVGRWIVDPLDGTTNYIHQFPIFCISIGYEQHGQIQVAVIDAPLMGEVFVAIRGHGAYVNGVPLEIAKTKTIKGSLLATGFFGEHEQSLEEQLRIFSLLVREARGIRRPGAAAYDLAMVAKGVFNVFWERNIKPWDAAAGILLVEESGGVVESYRGKKYNPYLNSIIAGNADLVKEIREKMLPILMPETD